MKEKIIEKIIEYFKENEGIFNQCVEELDGYDGYLGDNRYYSMEELNDFYHDTDPLELLQRAYYGYDADTYTTDGNGNREHGEFNPNRDYFKYNGYGNLVSTDYPDYSDMLDEYIIDDMLENRRWIDTIDENPELSELFDELENAEEQNDEN